MDDAHLIRIDLLLSLRRYAEAEKAAREAIAANPEAAAGYTHLARALCKLGRMDEAVAAARTAVVKAPHDAWPLAILGWLLAEQRKWDEAAGVLRESLRQNPEYPYAAGQLSFVHMQAGRLADALAAADEGLRHDPTDAFLLSQRGWALKSLRRLDEALAVADAGLKAHPTSEILWNLRGCVWWDMAEARKPFAWPKYRREADRCFAEACRLDPGCRMWHDNRRRNALTARQQLAGWLGLAAGLFGAGVVAGIGLVAGSKGWFYAGALIPVSYGAVRDMVTDFPAAALAAPVGWLGVPAVPLTLRERRIGRLHWIACLAVWLLAIGLGIFLVTNR